MSNLLSGDFPTNTYRNISLLNTGVVIKAAKGQVFSIVVYNNSMAASYVKMYDQATAPDSTSTPLATFGLPASSATTLSFGTAGQQYLTGIAIRATTGVADNNNAAPAANDVVINVSWL